MTLNGRSLDDLPLAAYSTGVEPAEVVEPEPAAAAAASEPDLGSYDPPFASFGGDAAVAALPGPGIARRPLRLPVPRALPEWLAHPRAHLREPRLLLTGVIGAGVVLLVASVLLGGGSNGAAAGPDASATTRPAAVATVAPPTGDATVEVTGKVKGTFELLGASGTGPATAGALDAAWADATGSGLTLAGPASAGTRTTDPTFVLTVTVLVNGAPMTFSSDDGECTVGMALQPRSVSGSYVCKKLKSADGKVVVDVRGTYRT